MHVLLNANCSWNHLLPNLRVRHNHWQLRPLFCVGPYLDCIFLLSDPWSILLTSDNSLGKRRLYIHCRIILDIYFRQCILTLRMQKQQDLIIYTIEITTIFFCKLYEWINYLGLSGLSLSREPPRPSLHTCVLSEFLELLTGLTAMRLIS